MAPDGSRSTVRRIIDAFTATPATPPPWSATAMAPGAPGPAGIADPADPAGIANFMDPAGSPPGSIVVVGPSFPCPSCTRPLARGSRHCGGCGALLVLGVRASSAGTLAGAGLVVGLLVGGLGVMVLLPRDAVPAASAAVTVSGAPGAGVIGVTVTASAGAAMRGTTALNGRLAAEAESLAAAIGSRSFPTADVVRILRRMSADVGAGSGMVSALAGWPAAGPHQVALEAFYADLAYEIERGLAASVNSAGQYKKAAKAVLATLARMPGLDADARAMADSAGMEMPVVVIPDILLVR